MVSPRFWVASLAIAAVALLALWISLPAQQYKIAIAAGPKTGESYRLMKALQVVAQRHHPGLSIDIFETRGPLQNMSLLADGRVNLATVQADLVSNGVAKMICELYSDMFQVIVRRGSGINTIPDLAGKRIALPYKDSGEFQSFLFLASHYGLTEKDMTLLPGSEKTADWLFLSGDADAVFRIRGAGNAAILKLIEMTSATILPIPQAAALKLQRPALSAGLIPEGAYKGSPAVPAFDTTTVTSRNLLLARSDVPDQVVFQLSSMLFENRRELVELDPIAGFVSVPDRSSGTLFPIHPGAQQFIDREKPSILQQYAPAIALVVSFMILYLSLSLQLASWRRRRAMSKFNSSLLQLGREARSAGSYNALDECRSKLFRFLEQVVAAGDSGKISTSDMALFNKIYESVEEAINLRRQKLEGTLFKFDPPSNKYELEQLEMEPRRRELK